MIQIWTAGSLALSCIRGLPRKIIKGFLSQRTMYSMQMKENSSGVNHLTFHWVKQSFWSECRNFHHIKMQAFLSLLTCVVLFSYIHINRVAFTQNLTHISQFSVSQLENSIESRLYSFWKWLVGWMYENLWNVLVISGKLPLQYVTASPAFCSVNLACLWYSLPIYNLYHLQSVCNKDVALLLRYKANTKSEGFSLWTL